MAQSTIQMPLPSDKLNIDIYTFNSVTLDKFTMSNTYRGFVVGLDAGNNNKSLLLLSTNSSGGVNCETIFSGSNLTIDTSTNNIITIEHPSASVTYMVFTIRGSITFG